MTFDKRGYIDVTDLDMRKLVAAAFDHSRPQGLGMLHHIPGPITDAEIDAGIRDTGGARYDYTRGRSMKLTIFHDEGRRYWRKGWYDHSDSAQEAVLVAAGMEPQAAPLAMRQAQDEIIAMNAERVE